MKPLSYFAVAAQIVATHPVHVLKIEGLFLGATADRYLQVHDSRTAPTALAVPLKQWPIGQGAAFFQTFSAGELALANGLYVCVSDTDGTYTLSADTMDLSVELTDPEQPSGLTVAGDETTGRVSFTIWADGAGPKTLVRLVVKEINGTDGYVFMYTSGSLSPVYLGKVNANATRIFNFGGGLVPYLKEANAAATEHNGCIIKVWQDINHSSILSSNKANILAEYKP
jgi:hypothetical protein